MRKNAEPMFQSKLIQILDNILVLGDLSCQCQKITLDTPIKWKVCRGCVVSVIIGKEEITQDSDTLMELKERLRKQSIFQGFRQFYKKLSVLFEDEVIKIQAIQSRFDDFIYVAKIISKVKCSRARALNEVQILLKMDHKNIVRLYEVYEGKSSFYLIMEKLQRPLDIDLEYDHNEIRLILQQLLLGLMHLHRNNIVHRDIKPSNIMFDDENNIRIIDFGLASSTLNYTGDQICGTPGYIAPEIMQINEKQHLQFPEKCDLFSVGVLMYEMYTQENLFKGFSSEEIFQHNASFKECEMPPIPDNGQDLLKGLLQPDPFYRFTSQQALAHSYFELADESSNKVIPTMEPRLQQHQEIMSQVCKKMSKEIPTMITMQTTKGQSQKRRDDDTSN